jgi:hypothetical protein
MMMVIGHVPLAPAMIVDVVKNFHVCDRRPLVEVVTLDWIVDYLILLMNHRHRRL